VGQDRTGVDTPEDAAALALAIARHPSLKLVGVQGYGGHNMHVVGFENRRVAAGGAAERAAAARRAIERAGLPLSILSVGGTGSYDIDPTVPGVTEIQPGSYLFMDAHYASIGGAHTDGFSDFGVSLSVLTTVVSRPSKGRAITDGGNKALSTDEGQAVPKDLSGVSYRPGGDEYGILSLKMPSRDLQVGDKIEFVCGHCDTTVNLYNVFFGVRKGIVEAVWPIEGRGRCD
jgi:D-serine deaminase-like pyridoxal phosphate-dependent protein